MRDSANSTGSSAAEQSWGNTSVNLKAEQNRDHPSRDTERKEWDDQNERLTAVAAIKGPSAGDWSLGRRDEVWCRRSICRDNEQEFSKINKRQIPRKVRTQSQVNISHSKHLHKRSMRGQGSHQHRWSPDKVLFYKPRDIKERKLSVLNVPEEGMPSLGRVRDPVQHGTAVLPPNGPEGWARPSSSAQAFDPSPGRSPTGLCAWFCHRNVRLTLETLQTYDSIRQRWLEMHPFD